MPNRYSERIFIPSIVILIVLIGFINYIVGFQFNMFPLYLIPLAIVAWKEDLTTTICLSILAGIIIIIKIYFEPSVYTHSFFQYWDGFVKGSLLTIMGYGFWRIRHLLSKLEGGNLELNEALSKIKRLNGDLASANRELAELNSSLETRIVKAVEELRQKDKILILKYREALMGGMINNIAHQWRQPLNSLALVVQQVPIFYDLNQLSKEFVKENTAKAMELIQHMSRTIDSFRNFFRSDKESTVFGVTEMIAQTLLLVETSFKERKIGIVVHSEGDPMATGYSNEYIQVLLNILMNAYDALAERKVDDGVISIRAFSEGVKSVVTITDNAGGVADELLDKIFDPYFTTKGPDKGTGIGLYMSKTIIENMGGQLSVRNSGNGAEFRIEV